jgi:hypothetical protein
LFFPIFLLFLNFVENVGVSGNRCGLSGCNNSLLAQLNAIYGHIRVISKNLKSFMKSLNLQKKVCDEKDQNLLTSVIALLSFSITF